MLISEVKPFTARIIHKRHGPKEHHFSYNSLFFSINLKDLVKPIGNSFVAINKKALISIHQKDYGDGGNILLWVKKCLTLNNLNSNVTNVYLSTFPKILGFGFNPVNFWYCWNSKEELIAIIAEVNNTFGERKIYVLSKEGSIIKNGESFIKKKNFYVSPFIEVKGKYCFRFFNCPKRSIETARIELEQDGKKIISTSISGRGIDTKNKLGLKLFFPLLLFPAITIFRINLQALRIWFKGIKIVKRRENNDR